MGRGTIGICFNQARGRNDKITAPRQAKSSSRILKARIEKFKLRTTAARQGGLPRALRGACGGRWPLGKEAGRYQQQAEPDQSRGGQARYHVIAAAVGVVTHDRPVVDDDHDKDEDKWQKDAVDILGQIHDFQQRQVRYEGDEGAECQ